MGQINKPYRLLSSAPSTMNNKNPHNQRLRSIMAGYFADWFKVEKIWMSPRKVAASQAASDALDDFLKQHDSPSTDKTKE